MTNPSLLLCTAFSLAYSTCLLTTPVSAAPRTPDPAAINWQGVLRSQQTAFALDRATANVQPGRVADFGQSSDRAMSACAGEDASPSHGVISAVLAVIGARRLCVIPAAETDCLNEIAEIERKLLEAKTNPADQPTGDQSVSAQLGYQPTPKTIAFADAKAIENVQKILDRAKFFHIEDKQVECQSAINEAKQYFLPRIPLD